MAKEGTPRFEIPADMRALAEKRVEQAKQAFDIFISAAQHAVSMAENQAATMQAGAKEVGKLAMGFAELGELGGQDDRPGLQALNRPDCRIAAISNAAEPTPIPPAMSFCASQYFYCNASKMNV
jgi:hypothetical protein